MCEKYKDIYNGCITLKTKQGHVINNILTVKHLVINKRKMKIKKEA